jgi:hypothetical protein
MTCLTYRMRFPYLHSSIMRSLCLPFDAEVLNDTKTSKYLWSSGLRFIYLRVYGFCFVISNAWQDL